MGNDGLGKIDLYGLATVSCKCSLKGGKIRAAWTLVYTCPKEQTCVEENEKNEGNEDEFKEYGISEFKSDAKGTGSATDEDLANLDTLLGPSYPGKTPPRSAEEIAKLRAIADLLSSPDGLEDEMDKQLKKLVGSEIPEGCKLKDSSYFTDSVKDDGLPPGESVTLKAYFADFDFVCQ